MKVDYLWNRTGSDPEIEELENALQAFRLQNETPPELKPAETFVRERTPLSDGHRRGFFQLAAGFACIALLILSVGVIQILRVDQRQTALRGFQRETNEEATERTIPFPNKAKPDKTSEEAYRPKIIKADDRPQRETVRSAVKTKKRTADRMIYKQTPAAKSGRQRSAPKRKTTVRLTREEKEAYEQLIKALAITGSQMRIVREKIRGEQAESPVKKDGR